MKALVKTAPGPGLDLVDVPVPPVGHADVRIRILKTAICGTDAHVYQWDEWASRTVPVPIVAGHEFVGVIDELGDEVHADLRVGQVVTGEGHVVCGHCRNCRAGRRHLCVNTVSIGATRAGAYAEYLVLPASNVWAADISIPLDVLAISDPLGNAVHTALAFDLVGEDVLITGAGPVGCMAAAVARHVGARHIVVSDLNPGRLKLAEAMGASRAIDARSQDPAGAMTSLGMTEGFDVGFEMSGNPQALRGMLQAMCHGGRIALLGFLEGESAIDWEKVIFSGLTLKGIYGREMYETWYKMTAMLQSGLEVAQVITHRFPYTEYQVAFDLMLSGSCGKIILEWAAA